MANWNGLVMTDKGIALQSKVQAGEVLNITKMKLGSGTLPAETDIRKLTDLIKPEQNLGIGGREPNGDYCKISATISNVGLEAGYYVRELGVFAEDPDDGEILYAYTTDGAPDYLPAEGGSTVISQEFSVNIAVSDTDKINVEIDPGALATMGYVQLQIDEHNEDASAHEKAFSQHNTDETAHYDMTGATGSKAGKRGFAPAPKAGDQNKALFGNGQYQEVIVKTDIMVGATSSMGGKAGLVPTPAAGDQEKALFGDGTYKDIASTVNEISPNEDNNIDLNMKFFNSLSQLGLAYATVNFDTLYNAMPNNSMVVVPVGISTGGAYTAPNLNAPHNGTLVIRKPNTTAGPTTFDLIEYMTPCRRSYGRYGDTSTSGQSGFSGWITESTIVEQVQDSITGYIKYSDGRMKQWGIVASGQITGSSIGVAVPVTFSQPFINLTMIPFLTLLTGTDQWAEVQLKAQGFTTTGFQVAFASPVTIENVTAQWIMEGWWK